MYPTLVIPAGLDPTCSLGANLSHLVHVFEGYRAAITQDEETQPYSPGSARDFSFRLGYALALKDQNP